jgi:hypothetical protein
LAAAQALRHTSGTLAVQSQSQGPVACMGVNKWGSWLIICARAATGEKLPASAREALAQSCAWDVQPVVTRQESLQAGATLPLTVPVGPHPSRALHAAAILHPPHVPIMSIHHSDHCLPCATSLQLCLPSALMSAASQRRAPLLSTCPAVTGRPLCAGKPCSSRLSLLGSPSGRARARSLEC